MKNNNLLSILIAICLTISSCSLDETPIATATNDAVFGSKAGMDLYANSFYDMLPSTDVGVFQTDDNSDLVARLGVDDFYGKNTYNAINGSGWDWNALRNINYFIENCAKSTVPEKNHFIGLARFFRAIFYFEKIKRFGDVPWIDKTIEIGDTTMLYSPRNNRFDVMEKVLADLNFAIENITLTTDASCTLITKNVVSAYKSRVCLYEASFRKYHTQYNKQATANAWYQYVIDATNEISGFSIYKNSGLPDRSYRELFISKKPITTETILAVALSSELKIYSSANRRFISPTYGNRPSLTRRFINTYLNIDGTSFTDNPNYRTTQFIDEVKNRDLRLKQTIRLGDYKRTENGIAVVAAPNFAQTFTGYQPIKWCYDERFPYDDESLNDNAHIIMRYAEVLLNKAEALAELGTITATDWSATIGALRQRAGITGNSTTTLPTTADPYMVAFYNNKFTDPVLLEILRDRAIEMVFEGLRPDDLKRWKVGNLFDAPLSGIYVPAINTPYDLNGDGKADVRFYQGTKPAAIAGVADIDVSPSTANSKIQLSNGTSGEIIWNPGPREWLDKKYLYPIPEADRIKNPKLGQNPGWNM